MYRLVPEHERLNLMPKYLKHPIIFSAFESYMFDFGADLIPEYKGGYWDFYETGDTFFFVPPLHDPVHMVSPNGSEATVSKIEAGMVITAFALSHISFFAYQKDIPTGYISTLYKHLLNLFEQAEHASYMFMLID